jgi:hypothetical protein
VYSRIFDQYILSKGVDSADKSHFVVGMPWKAVDTQSDVHTFPTAYLQLHKQGLIHPDHTLGDGGF